ncbi:MAG: translation elongation factor-like protein [Candidatus Thorarchaeota archaeon]|jgi:putative protease
MGDKKQIGVVTRYFGKISVAAIMLEETLKVGDTISIEGSTTNFQQKIDSMQVDRNEIEEAGSGQEIAIKVKDRARDNDKVFLV